ncbi:MAG: MgtC/SapB family protein [Clostridia bacterium]|nr:MgtC/SapB family protein [Clostridia bacterium]
MGKDLIVQLLGDWAGQINVYSTLFKVVLAIIFSAIVGAERAKKRHAAGLRTFMLVSVGAVISGISDGYMVVTYGVTVPFISAALIIGIAIISCNAILFSSKNQLKGLTTSVCLWVSSVVTVALGLGMYVVFLIGALALILTLMIFPNLESVFKDRSNHFEVHLELKARNLLREFLETIRAFGLTVNDIEINPAYANTGLGVYSLILTIDGEDLKKKTHSEIIEALSALECVHFIEKIN